LRCVGALLAAPCAWAFSITMDYRATYTLIGENIAITAVGTHKDVLGS